MPSCPAWDCRGPSSQVGPISDPEGYGIPLEILKANPRGTIYECGYCGFIWFERGDGITPVGWMSRGILKPAPWNLELKKGYRRA
jgi:hypothetical protein